MAAPVCHVGTEAGGEAAAEGRTGTGEGAGPEAEPEAEREAEGDAAGRGAGALRAVFPRDPALFADAFPVERRYRLCGRRLRIAQHHGPRLGLAACVWEAALFLCRFLEEQRFDFRGQTVIELGAGTGIVGIVAALLGGDVTITDQPAALDQIQENIRLNFPEGGGPQARVLVWGEDEGAFPRGGYSVILGSDIVYHRPPSPPSWGPCATSAAPTQSPSSAPRCGGGRWRPVFLPPDVAPPFSGPAVAEGTRGGA